MAQRWRNALKLADFVTAATVSCQPNQYNKLGEFVIKAKQVVSIGYGAQSGMDNALGRIYAVMKDNSSTPVELTGKVRLSIYNPQDQPRKILLELPTEALNTSANDRTKQTPLPMGIEDITEDTKIVLEFRPDASAAVTFSKANSAMIMDITDGSIS